jgi:hypothetical protein
MGNAVWMEAGRQDSPDTIRRASGVREIVFSLRIPGSISRREEVDVRERSSRSK